MEPQISPIEVGGIIGVCIVLAQGIVGITRLVITKKLNGKNQPIPENSTASLTKEQEKQLQTLYDLHCKFDQDGLPLWFMPRSWGETLEKLVELIHDTAKNQEQSTKILEKIADKLS